MSSAPLGVSGSHKDQSIEDDFMYGSNVASANVYIRMGFLRKVYGILTSQLLLTTVMGAIFMANDSVKLYVQQSPWMLLFALFGTLGVMFALMIKRKETPTNYILLGVFTVMEAYAVGVVVTMYDVQSVLEAFVLTLGVTVALTVYTLQSSRDFSSMGAAFLVNPRFIYSRGGQNGSYWLFACLWILIIAGFLQIFFPSEMLDKALAVGGAVLFSLFIIFDTHMLMHKLSPEEYIVAAINLYLDILNLFLYILRLLGERKN